MAVLVTGGAGFIGRHVVGLLLERGYEAVVVDNLYSPGSAGAAMRLRRLGARVVWGDVSRWETLLHAVGEAGLGRGDVEAVVHLAAVVGVEEAWGRPRLALEVNVEGTLNVLELARLLDAERIVYASSAAVYGEPRYLPIDENHPLEPVSLYGWSKLAGETLLWQYQRAYGLRPAALRLFNVYGPGMRPGPYAGVVYRFIEALLRGEPPVVYGDGEQTRDLVYVGDVAEAMLRAVEAGYTGPANIGTGRETSINQLYRMLCSLLGGGCPEPLHKPPRPGDVRRSVASIRLAEEKLGWKPRTGLEQGLRETIKYYRGRVEP